MKQDEGEEGYRVPEGPRGSADVLSNRKEDRVIFRLKRIL